MAMFRSERGIGRGEMAESQVEVPVFAAFMVLCSLGLLAFYFKTGNQSLTLALAISLLVFGVTVVRVDFGVYVLVVAMLLSPEIEAGNTVSGERALTVRYDDVLILVIFLGVMVKLAFEGRLKLWQPSPINAGIVAYYSVCIFSTLLAYQRGLGAWDQRTAFFVMLKMIEFYLVFFLVGHAIRDLDSARKQMFLFFLVAMIVSTYGIYTSSTIDRVSAPLETGGTEPNTLGGYLTIVICVAFSLFIQAPTPRLRLVFAGIAAMAFFPLLFTLSRASYLAVFAGINLVGLASRRLWVFVLVAVLIVGSVVFAPQKVVERVQYTFQPDSGRTVGIGDRAISIDKSTYERVEVWGKVGFILRLGGVFTLFGGGVSWETVLDSQYARIILETGLVGLAAFLFLQWRLAKTARQAYRWTDDWFGRGIGIGMFATTFALIVHSAGTISFLIVRIMEPYWFLMALCVLIRNDAIAKHTARVMAQRSANRLNGQATQQPGPSPVVAATAPAQMSVRG